MASALGTPTKPSWRMAEQYFWDKDIELKTQPDNDGYVMTITMQNLTRRVYFDPAGRITRVR